MRGVLGVSGKRPPPAPASDPSLPAAGLWRPHRGADALTQLTFWFRTQPCRLGWGKGSPS